MLEAAVSGQGVPPIALSYDLALSHNKINKALLGLVPNEEMSKFPFFEHCRRSPITGIPFVKVGVISYKPPEDAKISYPMFGVGDPDHNEKRYASQLRKGSKCHEQGDLGCDWSCTLVGGIPMHAYGENDVQSDEGAAWWFNVGSLPTTWDSFGPHVTSLIDSLLVGPWKCKGVYTVEQMVGNSMTGYYLLLLNFKHLQDRHKKAVFKHFISRTTFNNMMDLAMHMLVRCIYWPGKGAKKKHAFVESLPFMPSCTLEASCEHHFGMVDSYFAGQLTVKDRIYGTQLLHMKQLQDKARIKQGPILEMISETTAEKIAHTSLRTACAIQSMCVPGSEPKLIFRSFENWWNAGGSQVIHGSSKASDDNVGEDHRCDFDEESTDEECDYDSGVVEPTSEKSIREAKPFSAIQTIQDRSKVAAALAASGPSGADGAVEGPSGADGVGEGPSGPSGADGVGEGPSTEDPSTEDKPHLCSNWDIIQAVALATKDFSQWATVNPDIRNGLDNEEVCLHQLRCLLPRIRPFMTVMRLGQKTLSKNQVAAGGFTDLNWANQLKFQLGQARLASCNAGGHRQSRYANWTNRVNKICRIVGEAVGSEVQAPTSFHSRLHHKDGRRDVVQVVALDSDEGRDEDPVTFALVGMVHRGSVNKKPKQTKDGKKKSEASLRNASEMSFLVIFIFSYFSYFYLLLLKCFNFCHYLSSFFKCSLLFIDYHCFLGGRQHSHTEVREYGGFTSVEKHECSQALPWEVASRTRGSHQVLVLAVGAT